MGQVLGLPLRRNLLRKKGWPYWTCSSSQLGQRQEGPLRLFLTCLLPLPPRPPGHKLSL